MSGEIAFANTALESFAALVTFVLLFACLLYTSQGSVIQQESGY